MERWDAMKREQDRLEEERENEEKGMDQWGDHDVGPEEETPGEICLNDTLPEPPERQMLLVILPVPRLMDYEKMPGIKVTPTRKS